MQLPTITHEMVCKDLAIVSRVFPSITTEEGLEAYYARGGRCWAFEIDGTTFVFALTPDLQGNLCATMNVLGEQTRTNTFEAWRVLRRGLKGLENGGTQRVWAYVPTMFGEQGMKFVEGLGFEYEGRAKRFVPGFDAFIYARFL